MNPDFEPGVPPRRQAVLTVSQLARQVADLLETNCPPVWVAGEVSNFTRAASGHWYFTLKDASAQVRCVMFRGRAQAVGFQPREGDRVEVRGLPGLYQPRGDFQLGVEQMRRAGAGDLYQQFLRLRDRLRDEGLLDEARKRSVPAHPRRVGVITSLQAAALRDVLAILRARAPHVEVVIYPSAVQGPDAPAGLVTALAAAGRRGECDVLLLVRGGGSIEDLWAFNDEQLARAIVASPVPVISGVGHETDFTIADFVADQRAPTPTAAAALAVPEQRVLLVELERSADRLARGFGRMQRTLEQRLDIAAGRLRSPAAYWAARAQGLRALASRLERAGNLRIERAGRRLDLAAARLRPPRLDPARDRLAWLAQRLVRASASHVARREVALAGCAQQLDLISPRAVLARGYAILRTSDGAVVRDSRQAAAGEILTATLAGGGLGLQVVERLEDVEPDVGIPATVPAAGSR
jgi:exodeoxyribonuclease VII large subunit